MTTDREGKPKTVPYETVNAMLLNEHRKVQEQANTIAELKNEVENLTVTVKDQATQSTKSLVSLKRAYLKWSRMIN